MTGRLTPWALAAAVAAGLHSTGGAQPPAAPAGGPPRAVTATGTEIFQWMLHAQDIHPVPAVDPHWDARGGSFNDFIVIILGEPAPAPASRPGPVDVATAALLNGGAVLVAADSPLTVHNPFRPGHEVVVTGEEVVGPRQAPDSCLRGHPNCPYVVPMPRGEKDGPEWALFEGLDHIATNMPSCLHLQRNDAFARPLAVFPSGSRFGPLGPPLDPARYPFAAGSAGTHLVRSPPYRFLMLADPSVFINQMMIPERPDEQLDNLTFARRVIEFLQDRGEQKKRRYCLFFQEGRPVERFNTLDPLMRPSPPPLPQPDFNKLQDKIVDAADQIIDKVQENDIPNRLAGGLTRHTRTALVLLGIAMLVWVLRVVWRVRRPAEAPPPPAGRPAGVAPPPAGRPAPRPTGPVPPGVFDRRQRELLRRNNLSEPVRDVVRGLFAAAGAPPDAGAKLPEIVFAETVRRPGSLHRALADLWKIGYGPPNVVTVQQWVELEPLFERAGRAHADGKWWFAAATGGRA